MSKELKKLMTEVAKGKISQEEADSIIQGKKTQPDKPVSEPEGNKKTYTRKRKQVLKDKKELK